jgi:hypothetical protein
MRGISDYHMHQACHDLVIGSRRRPTTLCREAGAPRKTACQRSRTPMFTSPKCMKGAIVGALQQADKPTKSEFYIE